MIEIRLFATFRDGRQKIYQMDSSDFSTVNNILNKLEILPENVAICLINGFHQPTEMTIKDGDIISLFPPVGGG